jgi:hypothetical protein
VQVRAAPTHHVLVVRVQIKQLLLLLRPHERKRSILVSLVDDLGYQWTAFGRVLGNDGRWVDGIVGAIFEEESEQEPRSMKQYCHD